MAGTSTMKDLGQGAANAGQNTAGKAGDEAKGVMATVSGAASDAASYVGKKADAVQSAVGDGFKSAQSAVSDGVHAVGDRFESGKRYFEEQGMEGVCNDLTSMVKRNPVPSILIALGVGFLVARAIRG